MIEKNRKQNKLNDCFVFQSEFFISLIERAFKMMKNGVYFNVIALLLAELFKILIYAI